MTKARSAAPSAVRAPRGRQWATAQRAARPIRARAVTVNRVSAGSQTRLIVLRGNSGSGKSAVAAAIRARYGRGIALLGQDNLRRIVLREKDVPARANIGLIGLT